jgi:DNA-binding transcriptional ArsR family regulator
MQNVSPNKQLDIYRAIVEPNRRKILELLQTEDRAVQSLQPHLGITLGAVSQHLQLLLRSGLVSRTKLGKQRIYRLEAQRLREVDAWVNQFQGFWQDRLDKLGLYLDGHNP